MSKEEFLRAYRSRHGDIASSPTLDRAMMAGIEKPLRHGLPLDEAVDLVAQHIREGVKSGAIDLSPEDHNREQQRHSAAIADIARARTGGRL